MMVERRRAKLGKPSFKASSPTAASAWIVRDTYVTVGRDGKVSGPGGRHECLVAREAVMELPPDVMEAVAFTATAWPKTLDAQGLLRELDALAQRVSVLAKTEERRV